MAILQSPLQFSTHFPHSSTHKPKTKPFPKFKVRAATEEDPQPPESNDSFENRLSEVRLRYRSGTGKKAELRKSKKAKSSSKGGGSGIFLPPVPLAEAEAEGVKVEFGFSPYSERINGRIAILGLMALLLVELGSGKSVINYHTPGILMLQVYFIAAFTALYCKYQKEKISVWPDSSSSSVTKQ